MDQLLVVDFERPGLAAVDGALRRIDALLQQRHHHLVRVLFGQIAIQLLLAAREHDKVSRQAQAERTARIARTWAVLACVAFSSSATWAIDSSSAFQPTTSTELTTPIFASMSSCVLASSGASLSSRLRSSPGPTCCSPGSTTRPRRSPTSGSPRQAATPPSGDHIGNACMRRRDWAAPWRGFCISDLKRSPAWCKMRRHRPRAMPALPLRNAVACAICWFVTGKCHAQPRAVECFG